MLYYIFTVDFFDAHFRWHFSLPFSLHKKKELSEYQLAQQAHSRVVADFQLQMQSVSEMMEPWCCLIFNKWIQMGFKDHLLMRCWIHGYAMLDPRLLDH